MNALAGQLDLFAEVEQSDRQTRLERFHGPMVPAPHDFAYGGVKKGDLVQSFRCPDCDGLEWGPSGLSLSHGWDIDGGRRANWVFENYGFHSCYAQMHRHGYPQYQEDPAPPPKLPGMWGWKDGAYCCIWTEETGWTI